MSEAVTPLNGARFDGFATIREVGPIGMILLRAKADVPGLAEAIAAASGCAVPEKRRIVLNGDRAAGWMGPDEYLLILPYAEAASAVKVIGEKLAGQHHLAADVSDLRVVFAIEGAKAADVLRKLTPADLGALAPGELRRSRIAQVPAAFWPEGEGFRLIAFRSVAGYVQGLLTHAAQKGSETGL